MLIGFNAHLAFLLHEKRCSGAIVDHLTILVYTALCKGLGHRSYVQNWNLSVSENISFTCTPP